jgi:hypothetical protein
MRHLVLNNIHWKLIALVLAILVWSAIKLSISRGAAAREQIFRRQPVMVLKAPDDPRAFRIEPARVDVAVQAAKELRTDDVQVFVNVTRWPPGLTSAFREVLVRATDSTRIRVEPLFVMVERPSPAETGSGNTLRKP